MAERPSFPTIRLDTIAMSQLSPFGQEIASAKWRNTNPDLYRFIEGLHPIMVETVAPVYNLILLEHELRKMRIPQVTQATLEEFTRPESLEEIDLTEFESEQPHLSRQITIFIDVLSYEPLIAEATRFAIFDTYLLLKRQAEKDSSEA